MHCELLRYVGIYSLSGGVARQLLSTVNRNYDFPGIGEELYGRRMKFRVCGFLVYFLGHYCTYLFLIIIKTIFEIFKTMKNFCTL